MATYRLYCMDAAGKIGLADFIEAQDDDEAIRKARTLKAGGRKCEVWLGKRLVASLDAYDLARSSA